MTTIPDIVIWTHRWSEWLPKCAAAVAKHTRGNYNLIVVCQPGTCHENMNRAWQRSRSRYTVLLDEDVEVLTDDWLPSMLSALQSSDKIALAGCPEIKDEFTCAMYVNDRQRFRFANEPLTVVSWTPAYVMAFDREKLPTLAFDERIPGAKGMTDVDACLQIRRHGLTVVRDNRFAVFHPHRRPGERGRNGVPTKAEELRWFDEQREYMAQKWGELYMGDPTLCPQAT